MTKISLKVIVVSLLIFTGWANSKIIILNYNQFEKRALQVHPVLKEKSLLISKSRIKVTEVEMGALLPRLNVSMGMGPAPGLENITDTSFVYSPSGPTNNWTTSSHRDFNLMSWGPFYGMEVTAAQPLNVYRYRAGHRAATLNVRVSEYAFYKETMNVSRECQEIYYGYLLARKMAQVSEQAENDFKEAQEKIEEMLDEEEESVTQKDLLKLKASFYSLIKGKNASFTGLRRAELGARFYLQLPDTVDFIPWDSVLTQLDITIPDIDTLKLWTLIHHPDLKQLANGLAARKELIAVAKGELGPDIFLFGSFKYSKAWSPKRKSSGPDVFATDPLNELEVAGGLGINLRLNFWSRYQAFKLQKLEFKLLKRKEVYAIRGLLLRLEEAYIRYLEARDNIDASSNSLRAAEAWLKGAAMDYDIDPSLAKDMISPYKETLYAKRDYFQAIYDYNRSVGNLINAIGWTYSDYLKRVHYTN